MTEPENGKCPHWWCTNEQLTVETNADGERVVMAHEGAAQRITAADDLLSLRPVALPCFDLAPEEEILAELEVTVLVAPKMRRTSHVLLTAQECDELIVALSATRGVVARSLMNMAASTVSS